MSPRGTSLLLLATGLLLQTPATADISSVTSSAFVEAFTATDGTFSSPPQIDGSDFGTFTESTEAQTEGGRAKAHQTTRVTQTTESVSVSSSGGTEISHCCTADDRPQTGAGANAAFSITVCVDERSTFTASGNASVQANGDESTTADLQICCDANGDFFVDEEAEDAPGKSRNVAGSASGVLDSGEGNSCVSLSAATTRASARGSRRAPRAGPLRSASSRRRRRPRRARRSSGSPARAERSAIPIAGIPSVPRTPACPRPSTGCGGMWASSRFRAR